MYPFLRSILLIFLLLPFFIQGQDCVVTSVNATALPCSGFYFNVTIDLEVVNPTSPGFTLAGNGLIYGTFLYSDLPVTVGPLLGDDESEYEFIAWDVENPACQNFTTLAASDCGPICHFTNAELELINCVGTSNFATVDLDFDFEGVSSNVFRLYYEDGAQVGNGWLYASSFPITITSFKVNGSESINLTICDGNDFDCCQAFEFPAIDCNENNCEIFNVNAIPECVGGNFVVHLDFEYDNVPSDSFTVNGNTINYGKFAYTQLPITLGVLNGGSNLTWEFIIRDSELGTCVNQHILGQFNCPPPCNILSLVAETDTCVDNEGYALDLELAIEGEGDSGYSVFSETYYYGSHSYDDLQLNLPYFEGSGIFEDIVTVCDNEVPGCCATIDFQALLCAGCVITNLHAVALPCNDQNEIYVEIDFDYFNQGSSGFNVSGDQMDFGNFSYEDLPIFIGPFDGDSSIQYIEFFVTDNENDFCADAVELGLLGCDDICDFSNLSTEVGSCTGNNSYILEIDFDFENVTGSNFELYINGDFFDFYNYSELPLTIVEFPGNGGLDTIEVCANNDPDCCTSLVFEGPECVCSIFELTVQDLGCLSDSTYNIQAEFFYENLPGDLVDIFYDGVPLGSYSVNDIPIVLTVPEGDATGVLTVCATDLGNCCTDVAVTQILCDGPACIIFDVNADVGNCTSDSAYILDISFGSENLPVDSVEVFVNGQLLGIFKVPAQNLHILNFPQVEEDNTTITVYAVGDSTCFNSFTFPTPDCTPGECDITGLVAIVEECTSDTTFRLVLEYESEFHPGDSVILSANGNSFGLFVDPDQRIVIENFPVYDSSTTTISLCSFTVPNCCDEYTFNTPDCEPQCSIFDLVVDTGNCTSDSSYSVLVGFDFDQIPTDSVIIYGNGNFIGQFPVSGGFILIQNFPEYETDSTVLQVCALGASDCCDTYLFETVQCGSPTDCNIINLVAEVGDCTSDSTYFLILDFDFGFLPGDSVLITSNEGYAEVFHVNEGHIVIDQFPVFSDDVTIINVCAVGDDTCCDVVSFETPDRAGLCDCNLFNLSADTGECTSDSTFMLDIVFEENNFPGDSVVVSVGNTFIGQFFNAPVIRIEDFPFFPGAQTTITVCALEAPDCCDTYTFFNPVSSCGGCDIFDLVVDVDDCTSDSTFGVTINFQWEDVDSTGFDIYLDDGYLGFFTFDQIPIVTSTFQSNSTGEYGISVCAISDSQCCESIEFEGPVCEPICDINDLSWIITDCDSADQFYFILDFNFQDTGSLGFNVEGNSIDYGTFSYANVPIQIGPFEKGTNTAFEFLVSDNEFAGCIDFVEPGVVECIVATEEVRAEDLFEIYNNGTLPRIFAKKDLNITLANSNGKILFASKYMNAESNIEINKFPAGIYIATIVYDGTRIPVKLVKGSY